jgi:hypothetical protein
MKTIGIPVHIMMRNYPFARIPHEWPTILINGLPFESGKSVFNVNVLNNLFICSVFLVTKTIFRANLLVLITKGPHQSIFINIDS